MAADRSRALRDGTWCGEAFLSLPLLDGTKEHELELRSNAAKAKDQASGTVTLRVSYDAEDSYELQACENLKPVSPLPPFTGELMVQIQRSKHLLPPPKSKNETANPCCVMKLKPASGSEAFYTHTTQIKNATLEPVWDEQFTVEIAEEGPPKLTLEVLSDGEFCGDAVVGFPHKAGWVQSTVVLQGKPASPPR